MSLYVAESLLPALPQRMLRRFRMPAGAAGKGEMRPPMLVILALLMRIMCEMGRVRFNRKW